MTRARPQILALNGGEVDGETIGRSDLESYANKAQVMENAVLSVKGGMFRAPGTRFIGRALSGAGADLPTVVRSWRFSRRQGFTLEIAPGGVRIVYGTGYVATGAAEATFAANWVDDSEGGGGTSEDEPTWPEPPPPLDPPDPTEPDPGGQIQ